MATEKEKPVTEKEHIIQYFTYKHLPEPLQAISKPFCDLAHAIVAEDGNVLALPRNPERTVTLRKLIEAKDAAVRAFIAKV